MRVRCKDGNYVIAIKYAKVDGKRLLLKDFDNVWYYTNDFFHENIAVAKLGDLTIDGFVVVDVLNVKDLFQDVLYMLLSVIPGFRESK